MTSLHVHAADLDLSAQVVVSATGTWTQPFWPAYPVRSEYRGRQLHAADYRTPEELSGQRVVVVGGGNSAAQVLAELSTVATCTWVTPRPPRFLPDDVDGRALFQAATRRVRALRDGSDHPGVGGLGGIAWSDGAEQAADAIIWCTGFRPALRHLGPLGLAAAAERIDLGGPAGTRSVVEPRLHLVGYGDWTGPASATLVGVGRTARETAAVVVEQLRGGSAPRMHP